RECSSTKALPTVSSSAWTGASTRAPSGRPPSPTRTGTCSNGPTPLRSRATPSSNPVMSRSLGGTCEPCTRTSYELPSIPSNGSLLERAYAATFPGHPEFQPGDEPITRRDLRAVHEYLLRAAEHPEKRVLIESNSTALSRIAGPLGVATAAETHFILGDDRFR